MNSPELWQVYDSQGKAVVGRGEVAAAFEADRSLYMANAHIWLWKDDENGLELLLQVRARHLPRRPGYLHASASGHINLGEDPVTAAIRETEEELGLRLDPNTLSALFVQKGGPRGESFNHVFTCRITSSDVVKVNSDEVQEARWVSLSRFDELRRTPEKYKLIDLGQEYFNKLIAAIRNA